MDVQLFQPHDGFFKYLMSKREHARAYLEAFLPANVADVVDLESLEHEPVSFVNEELERHFADVIYSARLVNSNRMAKVCFLLEHKSSHDKKAVFQMLHYVASAMLQAAEDEDEVPLIIPVLFYHGSGGWVYRNLGTYFDGVPDVLLPFLPNFDYLLNDMGQLSDTELENRVAIPLLSNALRVMKHIYDKEYLRENAEGILIRATDEQGNFYRALFVYFFDKVKLPEQEVVQLIASVLPRDKRSEAMSTLELFIQKGEQIGLEKGVEKGQHQKAEKACRNMLLKGFDQPIIAQLLEVDIAFVEEVAQRMKEE